MCIDPLLSLLSPAAGPSFWGRLNLKWSLCSKGKKQSPVDILPENLLFDPMLSPLEMTGHSVSTFSLPFFLFAGHFFHLCHHLHHTRRRRRGEHLFLRGIFLLASNGAKSLFPLMNLFLAPVFHSPAPSLVCVFFSLSLPQSNSLWNHVLTKNFLPSKTLLLLFR